MYSSIVTLIQGLVFGRRIVNLLNRSDTDCVGTCSAWEREEILFVLLRFLYCFVFYFSVMRNAND